MKKYVVNIREQREYTVEVEADDKVEAASLALSVYPSIGATEFTVEADVSEIWWQ